MSAADGYFSLGEAQRLRDLHALKLLYTPAEERFDRITRLTARVLQAPVAMISFITEDAQWIKSSFGVTVGHIDRSWSICAQTIKEHHTMVVPDLMADARFAANPLVGSAPFIRFYAGQPLHSGTRSTVGVLSVMDTLPRQLSRSEQETLQDLAVIVERELSRRGQNSFQDTLIQTHDTQQRRGTIDELTRMWNRASIMELAHLECAAASMGSSLSMLLIDVDHLASINESMGVAMGDFVLHEVAAEIRHSLRDTDISGRYGGDTFMVMLRAGVLDSKLVAERIRMAIERRVIPGMAMPVTVSVGVACAKSQSPTPALLISAADRVLNQIKDEGRNQVGHVLL
ncbi:diguanylate cyclase [Acidocella sp.]|uniref:GGDEF domain-containing protein n=1 Tax=Acidocella sp. TaxID=50710 RepID=UPI003D058214